MFTKSRSTSVLQYMEALDYINNLKTEKKYNPISLSVFSGLYPSQSDTLIKQGFFNSGNN